MNYPGPLKFLTVSAALLVSGFMAARAWPLESAAGAVFLNEAMGPRPASLGEAFTAVSEDVNAVYWNPAGLVWAAGGNVLFAHTFFLQGFSDEYLAANLPLSGQDALGINLFFSYTGGMEKTTLDSSEVSSFGATDAYAGLAWSHGFSKKYSAGVTLKCLRQSIDTFSAMSAAADAGVLARELLPGLDLGLTVRNLGMPVKFASRGFSLPVEVNAGAAYRMFKKDLLGVCEVNLPIEQTPAFKAGLEYNVEDLLFIRAGYRWDASGRVLGALTGVTAGLGVSVSDYILDYAYTPYGVLGDVHRISLTFPFGRTSVDEEKVIRRLERNIRTRQEKIIREHLQAAERFWDRNEYAQAKIYYEKVQTLNPQYPGIRDKIKRAQWRLQQSRLDRFFQNGMKAYQQEEYMAALVEWNKVVEEAPEYKDIRKWLNAANQKLLQPVQSGRTPAAARAFSKVEADLNRGLALLQSGEYSRAIEIWQKAQKLEPENNQLKSLIQKAKARLSKETDEALGEAGNFWQNEKWVEAVRLWRRVLVMDPGNAAAWQALETNQAKIRLVANDLYVKGVDNYVQNRFNEAIQNWKDLLVLDPENQKAQKHLESIKRKIEDIQTLEQ